MREELNILIPILKHARKRLFHEQKFVFKGCSTHCISPVSLWHMLCWSVDQSCPILATPWTAARQASLSIINSQSLLKLMSIESLMPSILSSAIPFSSCLQSFSASGSFPMSWLFTLGSQSIDASASASSPSSEYPGLILFRVDWFWSPCSSRDSQESSLADDH